MFTNNSGIDFAGASMSAYGLKFKFDNGLVVRANVQMDMHWDDDGADYIVTLVSNPGIEILGTRIDIEHDVFDKHPRFEFSLDTDDEGVFFSHFEQELMSAIMDMEYEKYYENYECRQ